jgi:hypothetical protein
LERRAIVGIELLELAREKRKQTAPKEEIVTIQPCVPGLLLTDGAIRDAILNHATYGRTVLLLGYGMTLNGGAVVTVAVAVRKMGTRFEVIVGKGCPYGHLSEIVEKVRDFTVCPNWDTVEIEHIKELAYSRQHLAEEVETLWD